MLQSWYMPEGGAAAGEDRFKIVACFSRVGDKSAAGPRQACAQGLFRGRHLAGELSQTRQRLQVAGIQRVAARQAQGMAKAAAG